MAQTAQLRRIDSIVSDAQRVFALQRKAYLAHPYPSLEERKQNLTKLEKMIIANVDELAAAVM
jgi:coniferyl-aldehyde dehydrogenase